MVAVDANNYGHDEIPIRQCVLRRQSRHCDYINGSASLRYMGDWWKAWHGEGHGAGQGGLEREPQWPSRRQGEQRDARARDRPPAASGRRVAGLFPVASVSVETAAALLFASAATWGCVDTCLTDLSAGNARSATAVAAAVAAVVARGRCAPPR